MKFTEIARPSRSHIWVNCPGSAALMKPLPKPPGSVYARDGRRCHKIGEHKLLGRPLDTKPDEAELERMADVYAKTCEDMAQGATMRGVEVKLRMWGEGEDALKGTGDFFAILGDELQVHDLKSGRREVRAKNNTQLLIYAWGVYRYVTEIIGIEMLSNVRLVIHMPAIGTVDEWVISVIDLHNEISAIQSAWGLAKKCYENDESGDLCSGEHCRYCPALAGCQEAEKGFADMLTGGASETLTDEDFETVHDAEREAVTKPGSDAERLAVLYSRIDLMRRYCDVIEAEVRVRLEAGLNVPGYKLVEGRKGSRKWTDAEEVEALAKKKRLKKGVIYEEKLRSPTQLEKLLKKPKFESIFLELVDRPDGKPAVAPITDKRPALEVQSADDMFEDVND